MSTEHPDTHNKLIQHHGAVNSAPVLGHEGTSFESVDASVKFVLGSLGVIALTLAITAVVTFPIQNILKDTHHLGSLPSPLAPARVIPPAPLLQVHPWNTFPELRAHEDAVLFSSGAAGSGQPHIPITQAMDGVVSQLQAHPGAVPGITVPGGQGRDFAGSLSSMPPPYQAVLQQAPAPQLGAGKPPLTIQGEIRKNAK